MLYIIYALIITLVELILANTIPILRTIDILFITVMILFFDRKLVAAAVLGCVGMVLRDILSVERGGVYIIAFAVTFGMMIILSEWVFTTKVFIAYALFGTLMLLIFKCMVTLLSAIFSSLIFFIPSLLVFPSLIVYLVINGALLSLVVYLFLRRSDSMIRYH